MRLVLTLAAALTLSVPATAKIYLATWTGTLVGPNSYDISGVFGPAATSLAGLPYRVTYRMDDALPGAPFTLYTDPQGFKSSLHGGAQYGTTAVPVTATITVNGVTVFIDGSSQSDAVQVHHYYDQVLHYAFNPNSFVTEAALAFEPTEFLTSEDLRTPLDVDLTRLPLPQGGGFGIHIPNPNNAYGYDWASGEARAEHLTISSAGAVPEPAAWTLMIVGFGLLGVVLRRRETSLAVGG